MPASDVFRRIQQTAFAAALDFLLIGGHAVNAHGYQRTTIDLDILARESQRPGWMRMLDSQGYRLIHETPAFAQFDPPSSEEMDLDLMFVDEATYDKLAAERQMLAVGGAVLPVPGVLHLIALKLHATRTGSRAATGKDFYDIVNLVRVHRIDVADEPFQEIFARYAPEDVQRRLREEFFGGNG